MAQHKGILTKGAMLSIAHYSGTTVGTFEEVANILRMPSLGGDVEKVEVTTLKDSSHQYIPGLREYGDMEFTLLFDNEEATANYRVLSALGDEVMRCRVELGDIPLNGSHGTQFEFDAILTPSVDEQEPNQAIQFTLKCALQSDIELTANPA